MADHGAATYSVNVVRQLKLVAIVEDDADERTAIGRLLRASGFDVAAFASAEAYLAAPPPGVLCLLLDLQLTGMSGIELLRWLRADGSPIPVVIITACDRPDSEREAEMLECTAYVHKPFSGRALVALLNGLARRASPDGI